MLGVSYFRMTLQLCLFAACLAGNTTEPIPTSTLDEVPTQIVNETEAINNKYPWMVQLYEVKIGLTCGGTIITKRHVLTAAHCTKRHPVRNLFIITGAHDSITKEIVSRDGYRVHSIMEHRRYRPTLRWNDIALVITVEPIEFNEVVGPVCLPSRRINMTDQRVKVISWERTKFPIGLTAEPYSPKLLQVVMYVSDIKYCKAAFGPEVITGKHPQMCLRFSQRSFFTKGDAGGPGIWLNPKTKENVQVGIVSLAGQQSSLLPSVLTNLNYFLPWIHQQVSLIGSNLTTCDVGTSI